MNDNLDQLSETFAAHEHLAPDAADVLAKAQGIARSYQRRRWAVRATGGAVMSAGLVAGGIALPGALGHASPRQGVTASLGLAADPTTSPTASPATFTAAEGSSEFFAAGYTYQDAVSLGNLWNQTDIYQVTAAAGLKLLDGDTLPVAPSGHPASQALQAEDLFFAAGYDYQDAVTLAGMWNETNINQVKAEAGQKLMDGQTLPIKPTGATGDVVTSSGAGGANARKLILSKAMKAGKTVLVTGKGGSSRASDTEVSGTPALDAYFAAGYDYNDAVTLGNLWNDNNIGQVKTDAGQKLLDGQTLPIQPSDPSDTVVENPQVDAARAAFWAAGYTYQDAVTLGNLWNESSWQAKADGGQKLLDGQTLPIAP
jgi:hypothetical protein